jgi:hypothetical protein
MVVPAGHFSDSLLHNLQYLALLFNREQATNVTAQHNTLYQKQKGRKMLHDIASSALQGGRIHEKIA